MRHFKLALLFSFILSLSAWSQQITPPNRAQTSSTQPTISADFNDRVRQARIWVDGTEFTNYLRTQGDTVTLIPPYNLDYGTHQVRLEADNHQLAWSFDIVRGYNNNQRYYPPNNNPNYYPNNNPNYYPNNNDPYYNDNNQTYYPNDPNTRDNNIDVTDILQEILPRILQNRY